MQRPELTEDQKQTLISLARERVYSGGLRDSGEATASVNTEFGNDAFLEKAAKLGLLTLEKISPESNECKIKLTPLGVEGLNYVLNSSGEGWEGKRR